MARGTVVFFHDQKGYGFIEPEESTTEEAAAEESESDDDVFFHMEDVEGSDLEEGDEVEFEVTESEKGLRAKDVRRV